MRRTGAALALVSTLLALCALLGGPRPAASQGPGPGGAGGPGRPPGMMAMAPDSFAAERDSLIQLVLERIKGRENSPAESVFKNIKVMKGRTAQQLLRSMDGLGRTLGVSCRHCHVENHWADEDKPAKQIARDMMAMTESINDTLLARVHFRKDDDRPHVGCFTCHRGHANPNFGMGRPGGGRPPGGPGGGRPDGDRH